MLTPTHCCITAGDITTRERKPRVNMAELLRGLGYQSCALLSISHAVVRCTTVRYDGAQGGLVSIASQHLWSTCLMLTDDEALKVLCVVETAHAMTTVQSCQYVDTKR